MKQNVIAALAAALLLSGAALAQEPAAPAADWMQYKNPYAAEQNNIANAHRTNEEIVAWSSKAVADSLSFGMKDFNDRIKAIKEFFAREGWEGYAAYLKEAKILDVARSGNYGVITVADGEPRILNSGAMGGAWHWEVLVPVMTSITQPDLSGAQQTVSSSKSKVILTMARVAEGGGEDGIVIKGWKTGGVRN